jgi:5-formyltetrahydrofolate cyclo-ligase
MAEIPPSPSKAALRTAALIARDGIERDQRVAAAQAIAARGLPFAIAPATVVSGYSPIRNEIDPFPLMQKLAALGAQLALPAIVGPGQPLQFRAFSFDDVLRRGPFGIFEPPGEAAELLPDMLLVPLAAFDRSGHRIGYGAGHYDRTLERLRRSRPVTAIGVAFAVQEIGSVPALAHDVMLDYVLTEKQVLAFRSN